MFSIKFEHKSLDKYVVGYDNDVIKYDYNKILEKYADFGYDSIGNFILNMHFQIKSEGKKEYNIEKRNQKYAQKMYRKRYKETKSKIKSEYMKKGINLRYDELDELIYAALDSKNSYLRFNALNDSEKADIKNLMTISFEDVIDTIPTISLITINDVFNVMRENYAFEKLGSFYNGNHRISDKNRLLINFNDKIVILDAFDFLSLFGVDLNYVLKLDKVSCHQHKEYLAQQETYRSNLEKIGSASDQNIKAILNDKVKMVYSCLMSKGQRVMNSSLMVQGYSVFTYPIKMIMADLGLNDTKQNVKMVADSINILTSLGLINKISTTKLKKLGRADLIYDTKKGYDNNYFYVKELDLNTVGARAAALKAEGVRIGHISHKIISNVLDNNIANKIFNKLKESFYTVNRLGDLIKTYGFRKVNEIREKFLNDVEKVIDYFITLKATELLEGFDEIEEDEDIPTFDWIPHKS